MESSWIIMVYKLPVFFNMGAGLGEAEFSELSIGQGKGRFTEHIYISAFRSAQPGVLGYGETATIVGSILGERRSWNMVYLLRCFVFARFDTLCAFTTDSLEAWFLRLDGGSMSILLRNMS